MICQVLPGESSCPFKATKLAHTIYYDIQLHIQFVYKYMDSKIDIYKKTLFWLYYEYIFE